MSPARVEDMSMSEHRFFCYKNFVSGNVKVKVNNFEAILRSNHNYPLNRMTLVLRVSGSSLSFEDEKNETKTVLKFDILETVKIKEAHYLTILEAAGD